MTDSYGVTLTTDEKEEAKWAYVEKTLEEGVSTEFDDFCDDSGWMITTKDVLDSQQLVRVLYANGSEAVKAEIRQMMYDYLTEQAESA